MVASFGFGIRNFVGWGFERVGWIYRIGRVREAKGDPGEKWIDGDKIKKKRIWNAIGTSFFEYPPFFGACMQKEECEVLYFAISWLYLFWFWMPLCSIPPSIPLWVICLGYSSTRDFKSWKRFSLRIWIFNFIVRAQSLGRTRRRQWWTEANNNVYKSLKFIFSKETPLYPPSDWL